MTICEKCGTVLIGGVCTPCKEEAEEDARHLAANAHFPEEWHVCLHPIRGKRTGQRNYNVWLKQGAYVHEDYSVRYSWHSRPTENPLQRTYHDQKWECSCGHPDCPHIDIVKQWLKDERAKDRASRKKREQEEKITADEVNQRIDERRVRPHVPMPPLEELPAMTADEYIAKMKGVPYVPAQPPADPRNCEYWKPDIFGYDACSFRGSGCPHRFNIYMCKLRSGEKA